MGLAVASWEQQLGEVSGNWEHRAHLVLTGMGLFDGTAATPSAWNGLGWQGPIRGCVASAPLLPAASHRVLLLATKWRRIGK